MFGSHWFGGGLRTGRKPQARPWIEELENRLVPATVNVNVEQVVRPVNHLLGVNVPSWDGLISANQDGTGVLPDAQTVQMVQDAGLGIVRLSNGDGNDESWHWASAPPPFSTGVGLMANFIAAAGANAIIDVNFGTGTPEEAAAYVAYLNGSADDTSPIPGWQTVGHWARLRSQNPLAVDDGQNFLRAGHPAPYGFKYFEVGNEAYYGIWRGGWIDEEFAAGVPANTYVTFAKEFAALAHDIDPNVKVGVGIGPAVDWDAKWNIPVLQECSDQGFTPGFLSDHFYVFNGNNGGGAEALSDAQLILETVNEPGSIDPYQVPINWVDRFAAYQALTQQYLGKALGNQAGQVELVCAEFNSDVEASNKQSTSLVRGLFLADALGGVLQTDYNAVVYWNLRNGYDSNPANPNFALNLYGWREGADSGLIGSFGSAPDTGPYTPYPQYFAEQLASKLIQSGGQVVTAVSDDPMLSVYAVRQQNGNLTLLVINKSPTDALTQTLNIDGFKPDNQATLWQYGKAQDNAQRDSPNGASSLATSTPNLVVNGGSFSFAFPSYSMTVLELSSEGGGGGGQHIGFGEALNSSVGASGPQLLAAASLNSAVDSIPDLAVTNLDGSISILLGVGDVTFAAPANFFVDGIVGPEGIVAGDFDGDEIQDLAVASNGGAVTILKGDGNGAFTKVSALTALDLPMGFDAWTPTYLATDDLDGDTKLDLVVADFSNPTAWVFRGDGEGTFHYHDHNFSANGVEGAEQVVIVDLNGDSILDVAVANKGYGGDGSVSFFKGLAGGFITAAGFQTMPAKGSIGLAAGDLDGDGKPDLAVANYGTDLVGAQRLNILRNTSAGGVISFAQAISIDLGEHLLNVVAADFDNDGRPDLAVSSAFQDTSVWVFYNQSQGPGQIDFSLPVTPLVAGSNPIGLIGADLNGDGRPDLVSANQSSNSISVFLNLAELKVAKTLTTINEDAKNPRGNKVATILNGDFMIANPTAKGIAVVGLTGHGKWQYSLNGGLTWKPLAAVSEGAALLVARADWVRFVPAANWNGLATISFHAWDRTVGKRGGRGDVSQAGFGPTSDLALLTVRPVNDRPVLNTRSSLRLGIGGYGVASIIGNTLTEVDAGAVEGIAIVKLTGRANGNWHFSTDGGATWSNMPAVSATKALLLRGSDLLQFVPHNPTFAGPAAMAFRAWDQTKGTAGATLNPNVGTAFSKATETASFTLF